MPSSFPGSSLPILSNVLHHSLRHPLPAVDCQPKLSSLLPVAEEQQLRSHGSTVVLSQLRMGENGKRLPPQEAGIHHMTAASNAKYALCNALVLFTGYAMY